MDPSREDQYLDWVTFVVTSLSFNRKSHDNAKMTSRRNPNGHLVPWVLFRLFGVLVLLLLVLSPIYDVAADSVNHLTSDGPESLSKGKTLFQSGDYEDAALFFWRAVLLQASHPDKYSVDEAFQGFMSCYAVQDKTVDGFLFIAKEVMARKQKDMALQYINQALA